MKYGKHTQLAESVLALLYSESFLQSTGDEDSRFEVILDPSKAETLSFEEQNGEFMSWHDLHEMESSKIHEIKYSFSGTQEELTQIKNVYSVIEEYGGRLYEVYSKSNSSLVEFVDNIISDFDTLFLQAALVGEQTGLFGLIFEAYSMGMLPCGWRGNFPEGNLVCLKLGVS